MIKTVNFYNDGDRVITLCALCAKKHKDVELIDKAGEFDTCGDCDAQNVPNWYKVKQAFISGTMNEL